MKDPKEIYRDWHWGIPSTKVVTWQDADYPDRLIEMGKLAELHYRNGPGPKKILNIQRGSIPRSHAAFDPDHRHRRIYLYVPTEVARGARQFWNPAAPSFSLSAIAQEAGGRHATTDYPRVHAQPIGLCTDITYHTWKKGDDDDVKGSLYIHKFGEESKIVPILAVDARGRLWLCGGNYTAPTPGITD